MEESELADMLARIRDKRGYLLPHHGLMAVSSPGLLSDYDALYSAIALTERQLSRREHEFVWLGVLVATDEVLGTHHLKRYRDAGGTDDEMAVAMSLTALAKGCGAYQFVNDHWLPHLPGFLPRDIYLDAFRQLAGRTRLPLAHMLGCGVHMCMSNWAGLRWQIVAAYEDNVNELELAEALTVAMFPGSVPYFVEAAKVWRELILENRVQASDDFVRWANLSGQGGYDEASGVTGAES